MQEALSKVLFSSEKTEWETPGWLFNELDREFGFNLDVCATKENAKYDMYFSPEDDGLSQDWMGLTCWMNPPYGREIGDWIKKAYEESLQGATVVCLLPARTDTAWFHEYIYEQAEIRFLRGRLRFDGANNSAPFPSMVVVFREEEGLK